MSSESAASEEHSSACTGHDTMTAAEQQEWHDRQKSHADVPIVPSGETAAAPHTREEHAAILESHQGEHGLLFHRYQRCGFSGAGNCCCGRAVESVLHPHPFTLARQARERDLWRCVCSKGEGHPSHQEAK